MEKSNTAERDKRRARRRSRRRPARLATYSYRVPMDKHPIRFNPSGYISRFFVLERLATIVFAFAAVAGLLTAGIYMGKSNFGPVDMLETYLEVFPFIILVTLGWAIIGIPHVLALLFIEWSANLQMRPSKEHKKQPPTPPSVPRA